MARKRPARRCTSRRCNGEPCRAWAVAYTSVCVRHGGGWWHVKYAAEERRLVDSALRCLAASGASWQRRCERWEQARVAAAAEVLGIPLRRVTPAKIEQAMCVNPWLDVWASRPQWRLDRRFGRRRR